MLDLLWTDQVYGCVCNPKINQGTSSKISEQTILIPPLKFEINIHPVSLTPSRRAKRSHGWTNTPVQEDSLCTYPTDAIGKPSLFQDA